MAPHAPSSPVAHASPPSDAGAAAPALDAADTGAPELPALPIEIELPYLVGARPRPAGDVNASVHDVTLATWNTGGTGDPDYVSNRSSYHPAARVRVDTRVRSGKSNKRLRARVLAEARSRGYWPFRLCFEDGLRRDRELSGKTVIRFTLPRSGLARRARLVSSELGDRDVRECLRERVEAMRFVTPIPATLGIELSMELWPGDVPVLALPATPGASRELGDVHAALVATEPRIAECYRAGLARDPALWGRIALAVEVDAGGRATNVTEAENQFPDPLVTRCVRGALATVSFPAQPEGVLSFAVGVRLGRMPAPGSADK